MQCLLPYTDKNLQNKEGATPLHIASSVGKIEAIKTLLEAGANPSIVDKSGDNIIHKAAFFGQTECFQYLCEKVSDASKSVVDPKVRISVGARDNSGCTALHKAAYNGHIQIVEQFIEFAKRGLCTLEGVDQEGSNALHKAAANGHTNIMELLISTGKIDLSVLDNEGSSILHTAAFHGQDQVVILLLKHCASLLSVKDKSGYLPIHSACCSGNERVLALTLSETDNTVNAKDGKGYFPLHIAVAQGSITCIDYLLNHGADVTAKTSNGESALDTAIIFRREDIALHLIERGVKSNIPAHDNFVKQVVAQGPKAGKKHVRQDVLNRGIVMFNQKPRKGLQFLVNQKFIDDDFHSIAKFLFNTEGLNSKQVGELLSDSDSYGVNVRNAYLELIPMKELPIDIALRNFLGAKFRLPGEAQRIDRMMEAFAQWYHDNNPKSFFANVEAVHLLAFAIIMLNTDLHNPAIKKKMTKFEFKGRVLGLNDGKGKHKKSFLPSFFCLMRKMKRFPF